jgi:hypothetical protein
MAPRRDAPIFRLQRPAPEAPPEPPVAESAKVEAPSPAEASPTKEPAIRRVAAVAPNGADRPPTELARYYSVHRQSGRRPDPLTLPQPSYVDAMVITMDEPMTSQDLAQPQEGPTLIRDANGRLRAQPAAPEGDYQ